MKIEANHRDSFHRDYSGTSRERDYNSRDYSKIRDYNRENYFNKDAYSREFIAGKREREPENYSPNKRRKLTYDNNNKLWKKRNFIYEDSDRMSRNRNKFETGSNYFKDRNYNSSTFNGGQYGNFKDKKVNLKQRFSSRSEIFGKYNQYYRGDVDFGIGKSYDNYSNKDRQFSGVSGYRARHPSFFNGGRKNYRTRNFDNNYKPMLSKPLNSRDEIESEKENISNSEEVSQVSKEDILLAMDIKDSEIQKVLDDMAKLNLEKDKFKEIPVALREVDLKNSKNQISLNILFNNEIVKQIFSANQRRIASTKNKMDQDIKKIGFKEPKDFPFFETNVKKYDSLRPVLAKVIVQRKMELENEEKKKHEQHMESQVLWRDYLLKLKKTKNEMKKKTGNPTSKRPVTRSRKDRFSYRKDDNDRYLDNLADIPPMQIGLNFRFIDNNRKLITLEEKRKYLSLTEIWTEEEKRKFADLLKESKKNFEYISRFIPTKSRKDCIEYYYKNKFKMDQ